jgi:hypothetical protein
MYPHACSALLSIWILPVAAPTLPGNALGLETFWSPAAPVSSNEACKPTSLCESQAEEVVSDSKRIADGVVSRIPLVPTHKCT